MEIDIIGTPPTCDDGIQNGDETGFYNGEGCGGSCPACPEGPTICADYDTQTTCDAYDEDVAIASVTPPALEEEEIAICEWNTTSKSDCYGKRIVSVNGIDVGSCIYNEIPTTDTCEDDGFLSYQWEEHFEWSDSNDYSRKSTCELANGVDTCIQTTDGRWHYDPNEDSISCGGPKSRNIPCPAQVKLPFFSWKNLAITIIVIGLIYLTVLELRKNRKKVVKAEEKEKKEREKDYEKSKRKVVKKKSSGKKKTSKKK